MTFDRISVIGLGKLGAPMAACFAARGIPTVGVDIDPRVVEAINRGTPPVEETGLAALLSRARSRLRATSRIPEAVAESDLTFVIVPTPSLDDGSFSLDFVLPVMESIGEALRSKEAFHAVVLSSTVMPGSTGGRVRAALERGSGKTCGKGFGLCYSPELIALGSVIRDFLNPDLVLIGESDAATGNALAELYAKVRENSPSVCRMSFVNAELTKLAINTFVTAKISFANMLARLCQGLPGADVDTVCAAAGKDTRVGGRYLKGATSYGGPCFPRDNRAVMSLAEKLGERALLAEATDELNRDYQRWMTSLVKASLPPGGRVGILGLSYKTDTNVVEEAAGAMLARSLLSEAIEVVAFDPSIDNAASLPPGIELAGSTDECIRRSDVVVIATASGQFKALRLADFGRAGRERVVVDCWRLLRNEAPEAGVRYVGIGLNRTDETEPRREHAP